MSRLARIACWLTLGTLLAVPAAPTAAFDPPVDRAGPLTVRIEGPEEISAIESALPVRVVVENAAEKEIRGHVELKLVDHWQWEPEGEVAFSVAGGGSTTLEFTVTAGLGTVRGHYPIHAFARFSHEGREETAHPILILLARPDRLPPAPELPFEAVAVPADARLPLVRLPIRRAVILPFEDDPQVMAVDWQGSEATTRGSFTVGQRTLDNDEREALVLHPPWAAGQAGTILLEIPVSLPQTERLALRFANGVTPEEGGDGVTFRVRAAPIDAPAGTLGEVLFERHSAAKGWEPGEADLGAFAGQTVRLQLESHPGPAKNTAYDSSFWAEPVLVAGSPPEPAALAAAGAAGGRRLGVVGGGGAEYAVHFWPGRQGLLDGTLAFHDGGRRLAFHGFTASVLGGEIGRSAPVTVAGVDEESDEGGVRFRHRLAGYRGAFDLVGSLAVEEGVLRARFHLDGAPPHLPFRPVHLEGIAAGPWDRAARAVYAGHGNVIVEPEAFTLPFDGHRLATSFVGFDFEEGPSLVMAVDVPPDHLHVDPRDRHYSLHAPHASTWTLIPADDAFEAVKRYREVAGIEAGEGVERLAGRFVFDLWGGRYAESAAALQRAFRYGLTDAAVIWHNWQRWGYDYRLPDIYPANPRWGSHEELVELSAAVRRAGVLFALHDNYIDFYPDAEGFSYDEQIAFRAPGEPVWAWLNEGRGAQSFRFRADTIEPFLRRNLEWIAADLAPDSYFIDVWTSIRPYDYFTSEGEFFDRLFTRDRWAEHFRWIRRLQEGGPQISESGHDQLIGPVDGATANHLRVGEPLPGRYQWSVWNIRCAEAERIPWIDAAWHDRFILHGAGYSTRYQAGLDARLHGIYSDDYITTEVLCGRPAMVPDPFGRDVVRKYWLTAALSRALALRQIEAVEFVGGDIRRQRVAWSGGGEVWVNRGEGDWEVDGAVLPQYGFLARVPTEAGPVTASIERRDGTIVETAHSPESIYVNGRQTTGAMLAIRPRAERFEDLGGGRAAVGTRWECKVPIPAEHVAFAHFTDEEGEIVFQGSFARGGVPLEQTGTFEADLRFRVPDRIAAGTELELVVGLYRPADGRRLPLMGPDDGGRRIRLGTLRIEGSPGAERQLHFTPHGPYDDPLLARHNPEGTAVDFGPVRTAAAVRITPEEGSLLVVPLPGERPAEVRLDPAALPWPLDAAGTVESIDEEGAVLDTHTLRRKGRWVVLDVAPGPFGYRLLPQAE